MSRVVDKQAKRAEIVETAVRVFSRKGFAATRVADIAREAKVAQGTIYLYFGSREEILDAAFESFAGGMLTAVRQIVERDEPAVVRLRAVLGTILARFGAAPKLARVMVDFWSAGTFRADVDTGTATVDLPAAYRDYRQLIAELLEQAKQEGEVRADLPAYTPAVIIGTIEGLLLQWIVDPDAVPLSEAAESAFDVILSGLSDRGRC